MSRVLSQLEVQDSKSPLLHTLTVRHDADTGSATGSLPVSHWSWAGPGPSAPVACRIKRSSRYESHPVSVTGISSFPLPQTLMTFVLAAWIKLQPLSLSPGRAEGTIVTQSNLGILASDRHLRAINIHRKV